MTPSQLKAVTTADGKSHRVAGSVELDISLDKVRRRVLLYVVPDLIHKLVLGSDFYTLFGLKLDFLTFSFELQNTSSSSIVKDVEVSRVGAMDTSSELVTNSNPLISTDFDVERSRKNKKSNRRI